MVGWWLLLHRGVVKEGQREGVKSIRGWNAAQTLAVGQL